MGCVSSKGVDIELDCSSLEQQHHHRHQHENQQQQQQQQQHPQADLVLRVLLSTDPRSPHAKGLLRPFHMVCREGRAAALRTITLLNMARFRRRRNKRCSFRSVSSFIPAADKASLLLMHAKQLPGLLRVLAKQQWQLTQQGTGVATQCQAASLALNASSSSTSNIVTGPAAITTTATTTTMCSSSSSSRSGCVTATSSTTGTAGSSLQPGGVQAARPPGPVLRTMLLTGQPSRAAVRRLVKLLDVLPAARHLENLFWGDLKSSLLFSECTGTSFLDDGSADEGGASSCSEDSSGWRGSCRMLFIGEWTEQVMLEDVMLLVQQLQQLDALHVFGVDVSSLPQHATCLHGLEHLSLEDCNGLDEKGVVRSLAALTSLRSLSVHGCSMWKLPGAFPALQRLRSLDLSGQGVDEDVVEAVCNISSLEVLDLSRSPSLHSLPDSISRLTGLYSLSLWESQVTCLPDSMTAMSRLRELAWGGPPAEEAGDWLQLNVVWRLTGLDTLALSDALARSLGNSLGQLTRLSALLVEGEAVKALPDGLSKLVGLERLTINAGKLKALPAGITALTQLTELVLDCPLLQRMEPAVQAFVSGCSKKENTSSE